MSPKSVNTITSIIVLLSLTSVSTLPSAAAHTGTGCHGFDSISDLLNHYDIPRGLFPNTVKDFTCDPVNKNALRISIRLEGECKVTRELLGVGNVVTCQPEISAIISYRQLTHVKGVTVSLTFQGHPVGELMTVTGAKVFKSWVGKYLEFNSDKGNSPWFPVNLIQEPPTCDRPRAAAVDMSDESDGEVAVENNVDTPAWVYKYGRLLPVVALSS